MSAWAAITCLAAGLAAGLMVPVVPRVPVSAAAGALLPSGEVVALDGRETPGLLRRFAWPASLLAGAGAALFVGGVPGLAAGAVAAGACLRTILKSEDPQARRHRELASAQLPQLVLLLGSSLRGGSPPSVALTVACAALPGPAAARLDVVRARLALGLDPVAVWGALVDDPVLAPLARTVARATRSGAPIADAVERLSVDLAARRRADQEDRARSVGVRAALPLGLCLLPAFLLLGIVPLVAALFGELTR